MPTQPSTTKAQLPFGHWPSSLSAQSLASGSARYGEPKIIQGGMVWPQSLPDEGGRATLMFSAIAALGSAEGSNSTTPNTYGEPIALLPAPWSICSKVHEYGGGAYAIDEAKNRLFFVNAVDQQIYRFDLKQNELEQDQPIKIVEPQPLTNTPLSRFADLTIHPSGQWLFCVRESFDHGKAAHPTASIVAIDLRADAESIIAPRPMASGEDFYAGLTASPDGRKVAFISWCHPNMPWDSTQLWELEWCDESDLAEPRLLIDSFSAPATSQSIVQPKYSPSNQLYYVSDKTGWWNIYAYAAQSDKQLPIAAIEAECATPQWTFGMSNWCFWDSETLLFAASQDGAWTLNSYHLKTHQQTRICEDYSVFSHLTCNTTLSEEPCVALITGNPTSTNAPSFLTRDTSVPKAGQWAIARIEQNASPLSTDNISVPRSFWFESSHQEHAHLWFYPPQNADYYDSNDNKPPLIVLGHGGPTGATDTALNLKIQFWTTRGFAVADVNYRGSTGFGREYRQRLNKQWGILDVDDLCAAANFLVAEGLVHPAKKVIKGSSAGGYSVLAALTQHTTFDAGVSLYGIADLEALTNDTHKFEAHYLDNLIGNYPEEKSVYDARSPINHVDGLNCPILVAQGLDDKVVPPEQAELIVSAAQKKGIPVEYLPFKGEGHGFRQAGTIIELFTREHAFYCRTLKL